MKNSTYRTELAWLQIADCLTTMLFLKFGIQEANGLVAAVIRSYGINGLVILKATGVGVASLWGIFASDIWIYKAVVWFYRALIVWNLLVLWIIK